MSHLLSSNKCSQGPQPHMEGRSWSCTHINIRSAWVSSSLLPSRIISRFCPLGILDLSFSLLVTCRRKEGDTYYAKEPYGKTHNILKHIETSFQHKGRPQGESYFYGLCDDRKTFDFRRTRCLDVFWFVDLVLMVCYLARTK